MATSNLIVLKIATVTPADVVASVVVILVVETTLAAAPLPETIIEAEIIPLHLHTEEEIPTVREDPKVLHAEGTTHVLDHLLAAEIRGRLKVVVIVTIDKNENTIKSVPF